TTSGARVPLQLRTIVLPAPPQGVVRRVYVSGSRAGAPARALPAHASEAWANFVFAAQPTARQPIVVRWYRPDGTLLGTARKSNRPVVSSFIRSTGGIPHGVWRAELVVGRTVVQRLNVPVR